MVKAKVYSAQCMQCKAKQVDLISPSPSTLDPVNHEQRLLNDDHFKSKLISIVEHIEDLDRIDNVQIKVDDIAFSSVACLQPEAPWTTDLAIEGMTCSACVGSITNAVKVLPFVQSVSVSLLTNSATVVFSGESNLQQIIQTIEDAGFDVLLTHVSQQKAAKTKNVEKEVWKVEMAIGGMTCSACVNAINNVLEQLPFVKTVSINLISHNGVVEFEGQQNLHAIKEAIEDAGFECTTVKMDSVDQPRVQDHQSREVSIAISELGCHKCPSRLVRKLQETYGQAIDISERPTIEHPIMEIVYTAKAPEFTIRQILKTIESIDSHWIPTIYHPPTIEDRSRELQAREQKRILLRLSLAVTAAVPAFIIGVVCMSIMKKSDAIRMFMMHPMWVGKVSRADWALFILATPVYFFVADTFHRKCIKEIRALWRPGSRTPILQRFIRFGSMNVLMSLGTSVAYFSSITEIIIAATQRNKPVQSDRYSFHGTSTGPYTDTMPHDLDSQEHRMMAIEDEIHNYFDSVIFLTLFLLLGRFIEAYTKARTGDAVTALGKLRPTEAILIEKAGVIERKVTVDLLDVGDVVLVPHGASSPFDGVVVSDTAQFDESSLTGESKLVTKHPGDIVYSGTVNKTGPISIKLINVSGSSMLDQIIKIVREGQIKRAPVERAADIITSHFVPFVILVGVTTWLIWLFLGLSGKLPQRWVEGSYAGWPLWSLRFAIAVFVVACPCGIGLAAPTALFVGGGLAAKCGILVKGGGEAFQEASSLDCIVFDKTGTLTQGGEPQVVHYKRLTDTKENELLGMVKAIEGNSGHPIAGAVIAHCDSKTTEMHVPTEVEELPGKGMLGKFVIENASNERVTVDVLVGNEVLMNDHNIVVDIDVANTLMQWKKAGNSIVLVSFKTPSQLKQPDANGWVLTAIFAVADVLRPESKFVVEALQNRKIAVWMLSGDNVDTAQAVGGMLGIPKENIIAGVLPQQKAQKIQYLQQTIVMGQKRMGKKRGLVAMVGDGINDSPALTMADVGIAIGSGSDVAISSAEFILISSDLTAIITLIDLSRVVFRRVWFNFGWALVYNIVAMPVATGAFYAIVSNGRHITLDPVWASLAMALSSISVICSSLLLRSRLPLVGFLPTTITHRPELAASK